MNEETMIKWIDEASYTQLLYKIRFAPIGSPFFQGRVGEHFQKVCAKRRAEIGDAGHVKASKEIGWQG